MIFPVAPGSTEARRPISSRWNVQSWPAVYVIDREGMIRYIGGIDKAQLDAAVSRLLHAHQ